MRTMGFHVWPLALCLGLGVLMATPSQGASGGGSPGGGTSSSWPDRGSVSKPSEYRKAQKLIDKEDYDGAIELLQKALRKAPRDADVLNLLGFTHRKTDRLDEALGYYRQALDVDPNHRGAREYLGELFLMRDQLSEAQFQLEQLERICPDGCEEREMLKASIDAYIAAL